MGDIWLPGLGPRYTDYANCLRLLEPLMPTHEDAVILAAIGGNEGGYDWAVINDTPATGDYSVGIWQINYYDGLYAGRAAAYGTPRQLILSGPAGQAKAAADLWHAAGGFSPWAADITGNLWQKYVGSGPVPHSPGLGSIGPITRSFNQSAAQLKAASLAMAKSGKGIVDVLDQLRPIGGPGWRP